MIIIHYLLVVFPLLPLLFFSVPVVVLQRTARWGHRVYTKGLTLFIIIYSLHIFPWLCSLIDAKHRRTVEIAEGLFLPWHSCYSHSATQGSEESH